MQYIKLRSSVCIIQLQTGQHRRNNIQKQLKVRLSLIYGIRNKTVEIIITDNVIRLHGKYFL